MEPREHPLFPIGLIDALTEGVSDVVLVLHQILTFTELTITPSRMHERTLIKILGQTLKTLAGE